MMVEVTGLKFENNSNIRLLIMYHCQTVKEFALN